MSSKSEQLLDLYSQIENKSNDEIEDLISSFVIDARFYGTGSISGFPLYKVIKRGLFKTEPNSIDVNRLQDVCVSLANSHKYKNQIRLILQSNPQSTNFVINIIQLLAPAIAQQFYGIPMMAVVGSLTILCRQGIEKFLKD